MTIPFPRGPFDVIYADPPWHYERDIVGASLTPQNAADVYDTMKTPDIAALPVADIAADDSLLFLWTTGLRMPDALEVGTAWGFKYITVAFVWEKMAPILGSYTMSSCEFCLVFKRGRIPTPRGDRNVRQFLQRSRARHSEKPDEIRDRIHFMFPHQAKIELFARAREGLFPTHHLLGWSYWGDQS